MSERLDMDAINRQYFEKRGYTKSNKNQAADCFVQLATALGFSLDLLKEDWNHNKRYSFALQDVELIIDLLDRIKSREGKRLRCRDYQGVESCLRPDPIFGDEPSAMEIAYQRRFRRPFVQREKMG